LFRSVYYKIYKSFLKKTEKKKFKYKFLLKGLLKKSAGRNNLGKITSYHRGGGVKQLKRQINFNYINLLKNNLIN
jgi:ribosomal protein L2